MGQDHIGEEISYTSTERTPRGMGLGCLSRSQSRMKAAAYNQRNRVTNLKRRVIDHHIGVHLAFQKSLAQQSDLHLTLVETTRLVPKGDLVSSARHERAQ